MKITVHFNTWKTIFFLIFISGEKERSGYMQKLAQLTNAFDHYSVAIS